MQHDTKSSALCRNDLYVPGIVALIKIVLHLSVRGGYGIFRDEYYYLACARNLDWGYVDHPALSPLFLALWTGLFGDGIVAIRLPAIVVGAAIVFVTGLVTREMGGGKFAQMIACLAVLIAPLLLAVSNFYSMNVFDQLCWLLLAWILVRIINSGESRYWILFGLVAGVGLENKVSVLFFGFGTVVALMLTAYRKEFLKKEIWIGGLLAGLLLLPYLIWQGFHDFATREFMHNAATMKNMPMTPLQLFLGAVIEMHPMNAIVWLAGLGYALFHPIGKRYRLLGVCFLVVFLAFGLNNGKVYYLSPIMPMMLALGGVAWERWTRNRSKWRVALVVSMSLSGMALLPMSLPILTPKQYSAYQQWIGLEPKQMERDALGVLPQHFADCFGWEELAAFVEGHYKPLAPADGSPLTIVVGNYGEAGALEYYTRTHTLPRAVSGHNNYFLWGPGNFTTEVFLAYGIEREALEAVCDSVEEVGRFSHPYAMPDANGRSLYICRGLKQPVESLWPLLKRYI